MLKKLAVFVTFLLTFNLGCGLLKPKNTPPQNQQQTAQQQPTPPDTKQATPPAQATPQPKPQTQPKAKPKALAPSTPKTVVSVPIPPAPTTTVTSPDIQEVERMVLALVNQDRRNNGLPEVVWDETAARASQQHVQEEADVGYISHWGMDGAKPQLRYTRAGGRDAVDENESVTLWMQGGFSGKLSKADLYKIVAGHESSMLNEQPPNDGHRQNILDPHHTGLGIAIAVGKYGVAMAQEFTNHYGDLKLTTTASNQVVLSGRIFPSNQVAGIYAVWEEPPKPMTREQLMQTHSYSDPPWDNLHFWAKPDGTSYYVTTSKGNIMGHDLKVDSQGNFSLPIPLATTPGLDYISLDLAPKNNPDDRFYAGQFVMELR